MTTFNEYQEKARKTAIYPNIGTNPTYPTLGLCGEVGEVAEKIKKAARDNGGVIDEQRRADLKKELGDVLWYVAALASELKLNLNEIAEGNLEKLVSRQQRDVLKGSGDNR